MRTERVQVIDRSLELLESLSEGPRSLTEICSATNLSKGTAFRLLAGLSARGMVMKNPVGNTYTLGLEFLRLVQGALTGIGAIVTVGRTVLRELSEETGETVALHVQTGVERLCVEEIPSQHSIRYSSVVGGVAPIHNGAIGIVLLAFTSSEQSSRTLDQLVDSGQAIDRAAIELRMKQARQEGCSITVGERVPGATAIAVPVQSRLVLLALSVLGPEGRLPPSTARGFLPDMHRAAERLVAILEAQEGDSADA